jgi:uncharacterized RDD family membrane protein YckC
MTPTPLVSEFYERQRRLSYVFASVCAVVLLPALLIGFVVGTFDQPRLVARGDRLILVHRASILEKDEKASRLYVMDRSLSVLRRTTLLGEAEALLSDGVESTVFFGKKFTVLREGETLRSGELDQSWDVLDAVEDPDRGLSWIFGWKENQVLAAARSGGSGAFSPVRVVAAGPEPYDLHASMDGARGPLVCWREKKSGSLRGALYDGGTFRSLAGFEVGSATAWTAALAGPRAMVVYTHPEDRNFRNVKLRIRCCAECGLPPPSGQVVFEDPLFLLQRRVTGIAAVASGSRLLLVLTRVAALTSGEIPVETGPVPPSFLSIVSAEPLWRQVLSNVGPIVMLFLSFSLIFLGYGLFRERTRAAQVKVDPSKARGIPIAEVMDRVMAYILDVFVISPLTSIAWELLDIHNFYTPESPIDPRLYLGVGLFVLVDVSYHLALEATTGATLGKWILGLRVTRPDGTRVGLVGAVLRNLVRPIEAEPFSAMMGFLLLAATPRHQRLGDLLGRTIVIQDRGRRPRGSGP